jgi:hypothetical protein
MLSQLENSPADRHCRECGRLLSVRRFRIDLAAPDYRASRCFDCEDPDPFTLASIW